MVIVLEAHAAVTPAGRFVAVPIPVAAVVVCVIFVNAVLIHKVGVLDAVPAEKVIVAGPPSDIDHPLPPLPVAKTKLALAALAVGL